MQPKPPSSSPTTTRMRPLAQTLQGKTMCQKVDTGTLTLSWHGGQRRSRPAIDANHWSRCGLDGTNDIGGDVGAALRRGE